MAERYDNDPRLAFVETGFGLWAELSHLFRAEGAGQDVPRQGFPGRLRPPARSRLPQDAVVDLGRRDRRIVLAVRRTEGPDGSFVRCLRRFVPVRAARPGERVELGWDGPRPLEAGAGRRRDQLLHGPRPEGGTGRRRPARHPVRERRGRLPHHVHDRQRPAEYRPMDRIRSAGLACGYRFHITGFEAVRSDRG